MRETAADFLGPVEIWNEAMRAQLRKTASELRDLARRDPSKSRDALRDARWLEELAEDPRG